MGYSEEVEAEEKSFIYFVVMHSDEWVLPLQKFPQLLTHIRELKDSKRPKVSEALSFWCEQDTNSLSLKGQLLKFRLNMCIHN